MKIVVICWLHNMNANAQSYDEAAKHISNYILDIKKNDYNYVKISTDNDNYAAQLTIYLN